MQNFMKTILSAVMTWTKGKIKDSAADWNQNDSSADNYVKNRPFYEENGVVHKLDPKYLDIPEDVATITDIDDAVGFVMENVNGVQTTAEAAQVTATTAQTTADSKLDAANPVGTGCFSMNRAEGSVVGSYSSTTGQNNAAIAYSQSVWGQFNKPDSKFAEKTTTIRSEFIFDVNAPIQVGSTYSFDGSTGYYTIVNPTIYDDSNPLPEIQDNNPLVNKYVVHSGSNSDNGKVAMYYISSISNIYETSSNGTRFAIKGTKYTVKSTQDVRGAYAHIVGNGTSDTERSNAHTLDWNGNAWYQGDVYVGSTSGTNKDEGSKKLATEEYVDAAIATQPKVQSDWNQNNEIAADYIKNKPFGDVEEITEVLNMTVESSGDIEIATDFKVEVGAVYNVTIKETDKTTTFEGLIGYNFSDMSTYSCDLNIIGRNPAGVSYPNTDVDCAFYIFTDNWSNDYTSIHLYANRYTFPAEVIVSKVEQVAKTLDERYIPDTIARISDISSGGNTDQGGLSAELKAALVNYYTHVTPSFNDDNGLAYINAILTALGAEIRDAI